MNQMTDYQRELVTQHLHLVEQTIRKRVRVLGENLLSYDDFYQIGCEALCIAAMKYNLDRGAFEPFACRVIYNAIIDHCRAQSVHTTRRYDAPLESDSDSYALAYLSDRDNADSRIFYHTLMSVLDSCKSRYSGVALRGIEALEMKSLGYSCSEIAKRYGTNSNNVTAWMSRARQKLMMDPEFLKYFA